MPRWSIPRWLPNAISVVRVLLVPLWVVAAEAGNRAVAHGGDAAVGRSLATAILLSIGASDVVDGYLARRYQLQSRLGATLDAVADKLAQVVLVTYLTLRTGGAFAAIPGWFLALLVARDGLLLAGWLAIRRRCGSVDTEHEGHGRIASLLLFLVLVAISAGLGAAGTTPLLLGIAAFVVGSTVLYVRRGYAEYRLGE